MMISWQWRSTMLGGGGNVVSIWSGLWDECSGIWGVWLVCVCLSVCPCFLHRNQGLPSVLKWFSSSQQVPAEEVVLPKGSGTLGGAAVLNISEWLIHSAVFSWWKYLLRLPMFPTWGCSSLELVLMLWPEGLMCSDRLQVKSVTAHKKWCQCPVKHTHALFTHQVTKTGWYAVSMCVCVFVVCVCL